MKKLLTTLAIALSINAFAQIPTNGLLAHYPFTGNANDITGNGNNGTVNGATLTTDRFGNANSAYLFDGISNKITLTNANLSLPDSFSISTWINVNNLTPLNFDAPIIGQWVGTSAGQRKFLQTYRRTPTEIGMAFYLCDMGNIMTYYPQINGTVLQSTWYNVVSVISPGNIVKTYVNGVLSYSNTTSIPTVLYTPTTSQIEIGHVFSSNLTDLWFDGAIDDIYIYNRGLNLSEINALYNEGVCYTNITVTDTLLINTTLTGFNPVVYQNTIKIFPNPTHDHITINYGNLSAMNGYTLKITNSLGQVMFTTPITQQTSYISLSTWTGNGMYFVYTIDGQGNTIDVKKIVLQ